MIKRLACVAGCALVLSGCPEVRPTGSATQALVQAAHVVAPACRATLTVRVVPDGGEAVTLAVHVWADVDGSVRIKVAKLEVDILDLVMRPDGTYLAWSPRAQEQAMGTVSEANLPALLPRLALIADELTKGPLPTGVAATHDGSAWTWTQGDLQVRLETAPDGTALVKTFTRGAETLRLTYGTYHDYDGLRRARRMQLSGFGLSATAVLRELAPVPMVSPEGMRVSPAADAPVVPISALLEHLE